MPVPILRFKEFNDEWKVTLLSDLMSFNNGINAEKSSYGHGRKFINVLDILNNNSIKYKDIIGSVAVSEKVEQTNKVEYGDLLFLRSSETRDDVGKSSVYLDEDNFALFGGFVIRGKKQADYYPYFLKLNLESPTVRNQIGSKSGGSTRFNVSQSILNSIEISIPTKKEQEKIADFISRFDRKIQLQQKKIDLLKEQKKGFMQKIFSQELRFRDEDGQEFPEWVEKNLSSLIKVNSGRDYKHLGQGNIPVYGTGGYMLSVDQSLSEADSIGIGRKGTIDVPQILKAPFWTVDTLFYCTPTESNNLQFVYTLFEMIKWKSFDESTGVPSLSKKTIENIVIQLPNIQEQKKIGTFFESLNFRIDYQVQKLKEMNTQKQAFMQQMFI
ncbi:restriction endonuclease subunit S [Solibacillus sp. FSL W7-1436]|uniref:restriction endonuclease subunit S n=1 Tax=Solibacillus sp. FSL W7-1436 TaxID=2921705 RepID=UPI0030F60AC4